MKELIHENVGTQNHYLTSTTIKSFILFLIKKIDEEIYY
jgi:hypothetical protein